MTIEIRPAVEPVARPKTTADVLRHAALIIEERGWCQHSVSRNGAVCAWGGIRLAVYGPDDNDDSTEYIDLDDAATKRLAAYVDPGSRMSVGSVATWNDEPGRTAPEVVAALRAAADESDR